MAKAKTLITEGASKSVEVLGSIVHYVMPNGEHRPAIVVNTLGGVPPEGQVNLQVFTDGIDDATALAPDEDQLEYDAVKSGLLRATYVSNDEEGKAPGTWHWTEQA